MPHRPRRRRSAAAFFEQGDTTTRTGLRALFFAAVLAAPSVASGAAVFSEDFEVDPTALWTVNGGPSDEAANFFFDYSTAGIPLAPNSAPGGTRGMKLQANLSDGILSGFSVSPTGESCGDCLVTFDWWANFNGPFPVGGSGTTNLSTFGVGTSGTVAQWPGGTQDSVWFAATADGGSFSDWRAYSAAAPASYPDASPVYAAGAVMGNRNSSHAYYAGFGGVMAPAAQLLLFPEQTGSTDVGAAGMAWHEVEIRKQGTTATWTVDGLLIATIDLSTVALGGSNIFFGHSDVNATISVDLNADDLLFTLIDNVFVQPLSIALDIDGSGSAEPLFDGLLVLRYLFGFRGATLVNGVVDVVDCTRCDGPMIEAYLAGAVVTLPLRQEIRLGSELRVNTHTAYGQSFPSAAAETGGDFVVAWQSTFQDGSFDGIFARRFTSAGAPLASEFQVNTITAFNQFRPSVAADADGDFVVAWEQGPDGNGAGVKGVFARRFSSAGTALASEFQVSTYTTSTPFAPSVTADADGDFVVAWQSYQVGSGYGIFARRFSSAGAPLTGDLPVNIYITDDQRHPSVAADADGDFVVAWSSYGQDGEVAGVFARRFSSAGAAQASEFRVNDYIWGSQDRPSAAASASGDFVVAWESAFQYGSANGIFARRFSSAGAGLASEFQVNTYTTELQALASVVADADGDFVVAWESFQDGDPSGVFARRFSSAGAALASEFQVSTYTVGSQGNPSMAFDAQGHFVIVWQDSARDGWSYGVFAQRFVAVASLDIDGNGTAEPLTDGLLSLRYLFGLRGTTLISGAIGAGCTRCDASSIEAYVAGLIV